MVKFEETYQSIQPRDIKNIEKSFNITFPEEYKHHLLKYNGGIPKPDIFSFVENGKKTESRVSFFYAIGSNSYDDLFDVLTTFKGDKRMPTQIIPIAEDPFGNVICISCGEKDYGNIYFWDHEREVNYNLSNDDDYSNLYFIASSLNSFLENLREEI